jgi:hypothetical protein
MALARALRRLASTKLTYFQIMRLDPLVNEAGLVWPYLSTLSSLLGDVAVIYMRAHRQHLPGPQTPIRFRAPHNSTRKELVLWVSCTGSETLISINVGMSQLDENLVE